MIELFIKLIIGHVFGDYALQNDFLAKAKNHRQAFEGIPWQIPMAAHCIIHAALVWYITQSKICAVAEFIAHFVLDFSKCAGIISFVQDQLMHLTIKLVLVLFLIGLAVL